jgi:hypothetical protein
MPKYIGAIRKPVKRADAERYLLIMLLSFAASVIVTRIYLQLTGFPQIGSGDLHIAHMLWGGLLLFASATLMLTLANSWALTTSAILSGVGVGLFIDEVGKFITKTNDYFYPAAAPIIYAFFLLTVVLYLHVRRRESRDARSELYHAFEHLGEAIDDDLDVLESADIQIRLRRVIAAKETYPGQSSLAEAILVLIQSNQIVLVDHKPPLWERIAQSIKKFEEKYFNRRAHKTLLIIGLGAFGVASVAALVPLILAVAAPNFLERITEQIIAAGLIKNPSGLTWYATRLTLQGLVGLLMLGAALFLLFGRDRRGIALGYFGLLLYLLTVNLLVLYFDQFTTIIVTLIQFSLLIGVIRYRQRFLGPQPAPVAPHQ